MDSTEQWSGRTWTLLVFSAFLVPPIALIAGTISLFSKPKRRQGITLLVVAAFWWTIMIGFAGGFTS
jgi:hypothetical protein